MNLNTTIKVHEDNLGTLNDIERLVQLKLRNVTNDVFTVGETALMAFVI